MPYFLCRVNPPRPAFAFAMTEDEHALMETHAAYWHDLTAKGTAELFGPVLDPKGPRGLGNIEMPGEAHGNPVMRTGAGFTYDIMPIQVAAIRSAST